MTKAEQVHDVKIEKESARRLDSLLVAQVYFNDDPDRFTENTNALCDELEKRVNDKEGVCELGTTRILISGCPILG